MNKTGIILLSGGLDSLVSLDISLKSIDVKLSLTFNYGQKAFAEEKQSAKEISKYYKIENKVIDLPFLKEITDNALTNENNNELNKLEEVWIPNRNGLFLNIAGSYADKYGYDYIIFGANKEEGRDFPDNSEEFIEAGNEFFKYSTIKQSKIFAPCSKFDKIEIINYAIDNNVPLELLKSCYNSSKTTNKKHCSECMSCKLLYNAIKKSKKPELTEKLF